MSMNKHLKRFSLGIAGFVALSAANAVFAEGRLLEDGACVDLNSSSVSEIAEQVGHQWAVALVDRRPWDHEKLENYIDELSSQEVSEQQAEQLSDYIDRQILCVTEESVDSRDERDTSESSVSESGFQEALKSDGAFVSELDRLRREAELLEQQQDIMASQHEIAMLEQEMKEVQQDREELEAMREQEREELIAQVRSEMHEEISSSIVGSLTQDAKPELLVMMGWMDEGDLPEDSFLKQPEPQPGEMMPEHEQEPQDAGGATNGNGDRDEVAEPDYWPDVEVQRISRRVGEEAVVLVRYPGGFSEQLQVGDEVEGDSDYTISRIGGGRVYMKYEPTEEEQELPMRQMPTTSGGGGGQPQPSSAPDDGGGGNSNPMHPEMLMDR